jgi:hypothetical protein
MATPNEKYADVRFQFSSPGLGKTGQYQMSGIPFLSSSFLVPDVLEGMGALSMSFPYVTKFITVINEHSGSNVEMRVGFSAAGVTGSGSPSGDGDNYFVLDNGESYTGEFRVSSVFIAGVGATCTASVIAGMTGINTEHLTTNWSGTSGVG